MVEIITLSSVRDNHILLSGDGGIEITTLSVDRDKHIEWL